VENWPTSFKVIFFKMQNGNYRAKILISFQLVSSNDASLVTGMWHLVQGWNTIMLVYGTVQTTTTTITTTTTTTTITTATTTTTTIIIIIMC
jgi:hypothetical protein